ATNAHCQRRKCTSKRSGSIAIPGRVGTPGGIALEGASYIGRLDSIRRRITLSTSKGVVSGPRLASAMRMCEVRRPMTMPVTFCSVLLALTACAPSLPKAPLLPEQDSTFKNVEVPEPPGITDATAGPFRLMPGDVLNLRTLSKTPLDAQN